MTINEIRDLIAQEISTDLEVWGEVLDNTSPGNYGNESWDAEVDSDNVFVDIPAKTFTIKQGDFSAKLIMGASNGDSSFTETYSKPFTAKGKFDFVGTKNITTSEVEIEIDHFIYTEED